MSGPDPAIADVARAVIDAVEHRDRRRLLDLLHDDVEFHEAPSLPYGGVTRGKQQFVDVLTRQPERSWVGTWDAVQPRPDHRSMQPRVVATNAAEVVVMYQQRGLNSHGESYRSPVLALYEVRDHKLFRAQMFHFDTASLLGFLARSEVAEAVAGARRRGEQP